MAHGTMTPKKLTTLFVVDAIEPCLPTWEALGYAVTVRVPDEGPLGFVFQLCPPGCVSIPLNARSHLRVPDANGYSHAQATTGQGEGHYRQPADELGVRRRLRRRGRSAALGPRPGP